MSEQLPFLAMLDHRALEAIDQCGGRRNFRTGATVMAEGDAANRVVIIRSGLVKLVASDPDGHEAVLAIRGEGELIGELSVFDGKPRSASAGTLVSTDVQFVGSDDFLRLVESQPSIALAVIRTLTGRLRASDQDRVHLGADGVDRRLARELLQLSAEHGVVNADGALDIQLPFSQDDLAGVVGASRDAVARSLKTWRDQRLVVTGRRRITLLDPAALSRRYRF